MRGYEDIILRIGFVASVERKREVRAYSGLNSEKSATWVNPQMFFEVETKNFLPDCFNILLKIFFFGKNIEANSVDSLN